MSVSNPNSDIVNQSSVTSSGTYAPAGYVIVADGTGNVEWIMGASSANHAYYARLAAALEPLALEALQMGAFTYAVDASTTKLLIASYSTRLGSGGRFELRNPALGFVPLRNVTLTGLASDSTAVIIDSTLPTYTDARTTYFDRLEALATGSPKYLALTAASTNYPLLPGPYGNIILGATDFDFVWVIARYGTTFGWNLMNEVSDSTIQRVGNRLYIPISKNTCSLIGTGAGTTGNLGGILHYICPSTWGKVTDLNTYIFRDDFMGANLDTSTVWNRAQSTAGNVEIETAYQWCHLKGDGTWGHNGAYSKTTTARANGKVFLCDVYVPLDAAASNYSPNLIVGWSDAGGYSYTNFAHCVDFTNTGGITKVLQVFENGASRGAVGSGWSAGYVYRVRITLGASNNAAYAIQGGSEYAALGGSSWTDITPGTTSSSTTPLAAGFTVLGDTNKIDNYISDARMY